MNKDSSAVAVHPLIEMSSAVFNFEELWREVECNCRNILEWVNGAREVSSSKAALLISTSYTLVYHLVSHPCSHYPRGDNANEPEELQQMRAVFHKLEQFLSEHLRRDVERELAKTPCIKTYIGLWREYLVGIANMKTIFSPLTNTSPTLGIDENPFEGTEDIAFDLWKKYVLTSDHRQKLRDEFSMIVCNERSHSNVDGDVLATEFKDALTMLTEPDMYRQIVESKYDENMQDYYGESFFEQLSKECGRGSDTPNPVTYASALCDAIAKETVMAATYLQSKEVLLRQLIDRVVDRYIREFAPTNLLALMHLDDAQSAESVQVLYNLLALSRDRGLPFLAGIVRTFSKTQVEKAVSSDPRCLSDRTCFHFLTTISSIISRLALFFNSAFVADEGNMVEAMEMGIAEAIQGFTPVIPLLLVADQLAVLSNAALAVEPVAAPLTIEDIVSVYYFLPENADAPKEHFLSRYQTFLSYRLLSLKYNPEAERHALELLTEVKLSATLFCHGNMIHDVETRKIFPVSKVDATTNIMLTPAIVSKGMWPLSPTRPPRLSAELHGVLERTQEMCASLQPGRTLALDPLTSSGAVTFRAANGSVATLRLSLLQIAIVQLFNTPGTVRTAAAIAEETNCPIETCNAALEPLLRTRVFESDAQGLRIGDGSQLTRMGNSEVNLLPTARCDSGAITISAGIGAAPSNPIWRGEKLRARITYFLKREGPQSWEAIERYLATALPNPSPTRTDVKKCVDRLVERGTITRGETDDLFMFAP